MGISFSEYVSSYRHHMAKSWLAETDMAVKDIAEKLKYKNSQNFIRSFKKLEGITPGNYRQQKEACKKPKTACAFWVFPTLFRLFKRFFVFLNNLFSSA